MGKEEWTDQKRAFMESDLAEAFGYGGEQLAEEYDRVMSEGLSAHIPPAPKGEFEKILKLVQEKKDKKAD